MKTDDFEKRLQQQAQRKIPAAWREEIISASRGASQTSAASIRSMPAIISFVLNLWRELICPARRVWAGLAAAWVVILVTNANLTGERPMASVESSTSSAELWLLFKERTLLVAEQSVTVESRPVKLPAATPPRPRSQGKSNLMAV